MSRGQSIDGRKWQRMIAAAAALAVAAATGGAVVAQDQADMAVVGHLRDAIVGSWTGTAALPERDAFEVRLTFVSPKGGVSRYPGASPCGGTLVGDRKGDGYEYQETITYNGLEERDDGCLNGTMRLSIEGDTMKFEWWATQNDQEQTASGELHRLRQ
ncbi:MAG: hypothetical protein M5U16_13455 [Hyphomicrobium sp.]|nr:hypothetical protein [Hyphomicrobium sp.]